MKSVLIIEDESAAQRELTALIEQEDDLRIIGYAAAMDDAVDQIRKYHPDLIFMDINLYDCTAFDILNTLEPSEIPVGHIIFVTAYNQYAIKAIKYGALDYLLKPIDDQEFKEAVERFRNRQQQTLRQQVALTEELIDQKNEPRHIALPALGQIRIIALEEIVYCKGDGPYTHFFLTNGKKETVSKPLKFYEKLLPEDRFLRTHQSYIIYTPRVKSVLNNATILLDSEDEIPISHRRKNDVLKKIIPR